MNSLSKVELVDSMGSAKTIVNVARVSFNHDLKAFRDNAAKLYPSLDDRDKRLIKFLWREKHTSPFRHNYFQFKIDAPIFVLRQWMKHQVGCSWNEASGRYIEFEEMYYKPENMRAAIKNVKQGSGGPLPDDINNQALEIYNNACKNSFKAYRELLDLGVAKECARMSLPLSLMTKCVWTCSLHALLHFLELRLDQHSQKETRDFAKAVLAIVKELHDFNFVLDFIIDEGQVND